ncbi:hypothetical protein Clacol_001771 [Clathrus columnatus]|uniref:Protein disulfide-isomerase n=1 Tax=Clathrus columnatus TaxID=1419009 RepID=A0AAV5A2X7_9AGAM|nr:hypothetical protein Clacol_001771 [Clathrus columnatus]
MRLSSALASLLVWTAAVHASDVLELDAYNFDSVVNQEALILVEFFAPWCGHCKALAPHYETAATALKDKNISLAKVNCVDQADLCQQHGVQGYPTLKVFRSGEPTDYTGPRQDEGIIAYMLKQSLPAVSSVTTANFEEFKNADKIVAISFVADSAEPPSSFAAAAEKHRDDYLFGYSTDSELFAEADVTPPAIVLYRKFDEPKVVYSGDAASATSEDIEAFIKQHMIPYVDEVGPNNYQVYVTSGLPLAYLFIDVSNEELIGQHTDYLTKLAKEVKGKLNFVTIDSNRFSDHAKQLNIKGNTWPAFVIQEVAKQLKYPLDENLEVNEETVSNHVRNYIAGEVKPSLKSQPVPEEQNETVYTVVSSQFEEIAADINKDVFIEFYAPWCGHCKRLKPTWDSLGERYSDIQDRLLIAKMDATENDIPPSAGFHVSGFPSIKFKAAGTTEFIDYNGDRSLESLIEFVEANAKNSLEKPSATHTPEEATPEPTSETVETPTHGHDEL